MFTQLREIWIPRFLFGLCVGVALLLLLAVLLCPMLASDHTPPGDVQRLLSLFAGDAVVRRTAIAAAIGLLVTACVFFRPAVKKPAP